MEQPPRASPWECALALDRCFMLGSERICEVLQKQVSHFIAIHYANDVVYVYWTGDMCQDQDNMQCS